MIVIIDGYNLLKQIFPGIKENLEKQRTIFIQRLAYYKAKKNKEISELIIVFDAGPSNHALRIIKSGIIVIFSGVKSSADNWILDFAERNQGKELLVVTLDRALREACEKLGADWLSVYDFYTIMQRNLLDEAAVAMETGVNQEHALEKYDPVDNDILREKVTDTQALDLLMEQACVNISPDKGDDQNRVSNKSKSYTLSKKERRMYSKIKKLT